MRAKSNLVIFVIYKGLAKKYLNQSLLTEEKVRPSSISISSVSKKLYPMCGRLKVIDSSLALPPQEKPLPAPIISTTFPPERLLAFNTPGVFSSSSKKVWYAIRPLPKEKLKVRKVKPLISQEY